MEIAIKDSPVVHIHFNQAGSWVASYACSLPFPFGAVLFNVMVSIVPIIPNNALIFKSVRLRALQDSPSAFSATYAREVQLTDEEWVTRSHKWNGQRGIGFLALEDHSDAACGMVGSFLDDHNATHADLISMWTAATHRQQGVGRLLVNAVEDWARSRGANTLRLMVTSVNPSAIQFYERLGFIRTGRTGPYPNDPAIIEYEMSKRI